MTEMGAGGGLGPWAAVARGRFLSPRAHIPVGLGALCALCSMLAEVPDRCGPSTHSPSSSLPRPRRAFEAGRCSVSEERTEA